MPACLHARRCGWPLLLCACAVARCACTLSCFPAACGLRDTAGRPAGCLACFFHPSPCTASIIPACGGRTCLCLDSSCASPRYPFSPAAMGAPCGTIKAIARPCVHARHAVAVCGHTCMYGCSRCRSITAPPPSAFRACGSPRAGRRWRRAWEHPFHATMYRVCMLPPLGGVPQRAWRHQVLRVPQRSGPRSPEGRP